MSEKVKGFVPFAVFCVVPFLFIFQADAWTVYFRVLTWEVAMLLLFAFTPLNRLVN